MLDTTNWEIITCEPFLDASRTPTIPRMIWLPIQLAGMQRRYGQHCLFRRAAKSPDVRTEQQIAEDSHVGEGNLKEVVEQMEKEGVDVTVEEVDHIAQEMHDTHDGEAELKEKIEHKEGVHAVPVEEVDHIGKEI